MITLKLRIVLILMSLLILFYVLYKIRKSKLNITDSIYWVIFSGLLLILSLFPQIPYFFSRLLGIEAPFSFLLLFFIGMISLKQFWITIRISQWQQKTNQMAQKIAMDEFEKEEQRHG